MEAEIDNLIGEYRKGNKVKVDLKTSAALDASVKDTPGLYVRNDTDLVAKVVKIELTCKLIDCMPTEFCV